MIYQMEDSRILVLSLGYLVVFINYILQFYLNILFEKNIFIKLSKDFQIPKYWMTVILSFLFVNFIFISAWSADAVGFDLLAGGYLLFSIANAVIGVGSVFYFKMLANPDVATGHLIFSAKFGYMNLAAKFSSTGILMLVLFGIFGEYHFLGAGMFSLALAIGFLSRGL